eukprot:TRINITY_DN93695_c0_g1_i1.p2 TRINITY_DN93695_c0_g1~~TRINITY_DN93695_c0_g1_i1.p2  ORF type:complete len:157 (-),score=14.66 TRINITY_DN93695_c0_g1_i1:702-1172(-)
MTTMDMGSDIMLIHDTFEVKKIDPEGKKFDLVSRIVARSETFETDIILDINTDVYPVELPCNLTIALAKTLYTDGNPVADSYDQALCTGKKASIMDNFEYVMSGKVYKLEPDKSQLRMSAYISFGGLLMKITGEPHNLKDITRDQTLFVLIRKANV